MKKQLFVLTLEIVKDPSMYIPTEIQNMIIYRFGGLEHKAAKMIKDRYKYLMSLDDRLFIEADDGSPASFQRRHVEDTFSSMRPNGRLCGHWTPEDYEVRMTAAGALEERSGWYGWRPRRLNDNYWL